MRGGRLGNHPWLLLLWLSLWLGTESSPPDSLTPMSSHTKHCVSTSVPVSRSVPATGPFVTCGLFPEAYMAFCAARVLRLVFSSAFMDNTSLSSASWYDAERMHARRRSAGSPLSFVKASAS